MWAYIYARGSKRVKCLVILVNILSCHLISRPLVWVVNFSSNSYKLCAV